MLTSCLGLGNTYEEKILTTEEVGKVAEETVVRLMTRERKEKLLEHLPVKEVERIVLGQTKALARELVEEEVRKEGQFTGENIELYVRTNVDKFVAWIEMFFLMNKRDEEVEATE